MNKQLQKVARKFIIEGLMQLPEGHRLIFKRLYSPNDFNVSLFNIVESMPEDKLDWAMQQIERSFDKLEIEKCPDCGAVCLQNLKENAKIKSNKRQEVLYGRKKDKTKKTNTKTGVLF